MYKSSELHICSNQAKCNELRQLLDLYVIGKYDKVINQLIILLDTLVGEAGQNNTGINNNGDISACAIAIIDSKYRLGLYQECLDLINKYHDAAYITSNNALPELLRGWCYLVLSQHGQAEAIARSFLQSNIYYKDPEVAASFLFLLGKTQYALNKYNDARQHYSDSLALYRYAGNIEHACAVLGALGLIEKEVGRLTKSIEYYDRASSIVDRDLYQDRAFDIDLSKAIALLKHGNIDKASNALNIILSNNNLSTLVTIKANIVKARLLLASDSPNEAGSVIAGVLAILSTEYYYREEVICLETYGDIEARKNNLDTAELFYNRAEKLSKTIDCSSSLIGGILMRRALLHNIKANFSESIEIGKQSLALLESVGICYDLGVMYRVLSESYLGVSNYSIAYRYIIKSIEVLSNHEAQRELAASYLSAAIICRNWHAYYQQSVPVDDVLAELVINSYNLIALDNRTLYEAAWNHALEAHSLYTMYGNEADLNAVEAEFKVMKSMQAANNYKTTIVSISNTEYYGTVFVSYSNSMKSLLSTIEIAASSEEPVLITGETGTGKELIARIIHDRSERNGAPFVPVNCAAIPEQLFEREFFGNVKGAYTSAETSAQGLSEQADGGTLFLDEIGEMPPLLQAKLLRLLQDGSYYRLGDPVLRRVNIRVIAATNADINALIISRQFRQDCYYRLKTLEINIPPLRDRKEDIEPLTTLIIHKMLGHHYGPRDIFDEELCELYYKYPWPGNVRELESITRRLALYAKHNPKATIEMLPKDMQQYSNKKMLVGGLLSLTLYLETAEKERIIQALISSGGNRTCAAQNLGISRKALYAKMKRLDIEFPL